MRKTVTGYELILQDGILQGIQPLPLPAGLPCPTDERLQRPLTAAEQAVQQRRMEHSQQMDALELAALQGADGGAWLEDFPALTASAPAGPAAAFADGIRLVLPEEVEEIGEGALCGCVNLAEVVLPAGLHTIGPQAFAGCRELHTVRFHPECRLSELGPAAFAGTGLRCITLPEGLDALPIRAFMGCTALEEVCLPEGITELGAQAFLGCSALARLQLPQSLQRIGTEALALCPSLRQLPLPEGLQQVESSFFFTEAFAPDTLALPAGLRSIDPDNFKMNGAGPAAVTAAEGNPVYHTKDGLLYGRWMGQEVLLFCPRGRTGAVQVAEGTEVIGSHAFAHCKQLTAVQLPASLRRIEDSAFRDTRFDALELPEGLQWVGSRAFANSALRTLALPAGVKLASNALAGCTLPQPDAEYSADGRTLLRAPAEFTGVFAVPAGVETIGEGAFAGCRLAGVVLPEGLRTLAATCFAGCTRLTELELPDTVTTLGHGAFLDCLQLRRVRLSRGLQQAGEAVFGGTALPELILPEGLAPDACLRLLTGCPTLARASLPAAAAETLLPHLRAARWPHPAEGSTGLQRLVLRGERRPGGLFSHDGVWYRAEEDGSLTLTFCPRQRANTLIPLFGTRRIAAGAFAGCAGLTRLLLHEGLEEIEPDAFTGCTGPEMLSLPESLTALPPNTFDAPALRSVFLGCGALAHTAAVWLSGSPEAALYLPPHFASEEQRAALALQLDRPVWERDK